MKPSIAPSLNAVCSRRKRRARLAERDGLDSYRLIAGESDGLPGVTIDRFGNFSCCSCSAQAPNTSAPPSSAPCRTCSRTAPFTIAAMSPCVKEGLELAGVGGGRTAPALLPITEHGMKLLVDIRGGHKTGYYLDQRDSRPATRRYVADKRVLNCFSYTGGFAVSALMGGCRRSPAWIPRRRRSTLPARTWRSTDWICPKRSLCATTCSNCCVNTAIRREIRRDRDGSAEVRGK